MTAPVDTLVSITNCVDGIDTVDAPQTVDTTDRSGLRESRKKRYELQRVAKAILRQTEHPKGQTWRTLQCASTVNGGAVAVRYTPEIQRASYAGACICGSVWVCPVCSARISELRRAEIAAAHAVHAAAGGTALMLTLTVPHDLDDELRALLGRRRKAGNQGLAGALKRLRDDRIFKCVVERLGRVGFIRATEITRGRSGWHPHYHELWLTTCEENDKLRVPAQRELLRAWKRACRNSGLDVPNQHGVDLRWAWDASEYLAKIGHEQTWGTARELATAGTKRGRSGSRNPWQLLRDAGDGDVPSRALFGEFAQSTLGQRQLIWQRGLKAALAIADRSDNQLAKHVDADSFVLAVISADRWRALLRLPFEWRAQLLDQAEDGGPDAIHDFLDLVEIDPLRARVFAGSE